jgi:hypothetical protein
MREIKKLEDTISLTPMELFKNQDSVIMEKLARKYENKCWANSFVLHVNKILLLGPTEISKNRTDGSADINLQFEIECETFPVRSMLVCTIEGLNEDKLMCKYGPNVVITCMEKKTLISPKVGQTIAIIIDRTEYLTSRSTVSIRARPFSIEKIINVIGYSSEEFSETTIQMLTDILDAMEPLTEKSTSKFIQETFYPFNEEPKKLLKQFTSPASDFSVMDLYEIAKQIISKKLTGMPAGYAVAHPVLPIIDATIFKLESKTVPKTSNVLKKYPGWNLVVGKSLFSELICTRLLLAGNMKSMINSMTEVFKSEQIINTHKNIWESYNKLKINV